MLKIFDMHCDVLYKMWLNPSISFENSPELHITYDALKNVGGKIQCFAIYVPEAVPFDQRFRAALEMVTIFYDRILGQFPNIQLITSKAQIDRLGENEMGAVLSLEGCDAIGHDLIKLKTFYHLGVTSIGLTWNYANAVCDGVLEARGAGLSEFGKQVVQLNNDYHIWTDVSHACEQAFWDTLETAKYPIASHSNAFSICEHPRNLKDNQIKAIIAADGVIGITFVPDFLSSGNKATIKDVLTHIDYICGLGGENNIGFGSDFDGISDTTIGLENYNGYERLLNELLKRYSSSQVEKFMYRTFTNHYPKK